MPPILQRTLRVGGVFLQGPDEQLSGRAYAPLASSALRPRYNRCGLRFLGVAAGQAAGLVGLSALAVCEMAATGRLNVAARVAAKASPAILGNMCRKLTC